MTWFPVPGTEQQDPERSRPDRQIPEFKVSLGQREFGSRPRHHKNGLFREGFHPAILFSVLMLELGVSS